MYRGQGSYTRKIQGLYMKIINGHHQYSTKGTGDLILSAVLTLAIILSMAGCKKPEPARLMVQVEGALFSNALLSIDGKQVGKLTKTLITANGKLFIDDIYTITLPPGHKDIPLQDQYSGNLDSLEVKSGKYTIILRTEDGRSLQINASLRSGLNVIVYNSDRQVLRLNDAKMNAAPDSTVTFP